MGIRLLIKKEQIKMDANEQLNFRQIVISSFAVAWLNPQAILDGTIIFGSLRSALPEGREYLFILGVCLASITWFNSLALVTHKIMDKIKSIMKYVNKICGIILVFFGIKLGYSFILIILKR
jgi:L-lysine exporter family protein LysE/ArgO